jgi:hypothetical protein
MVNPTKVQLRDYRKKMNDVARAISHALVLKAQGMAD